MEHKRKEIVTVFNAISGKDENVEIVVKTEEEWRKILSSQEFQVMRKHGTERPFTGELLNIKKDGVYICASCGNHLFTSIAKYESETGWPSFWEAVDQKNVGIKIDNSLFMRRVEVHCSRCGAHLGHIFDDGPQPTGKRYCINSVSLKFKKSDLADKKENNL